MVVTVLPLTVDDGASLCEVIDSTRIHLQGMSWYYMDRVETVEQFIVAMGGANERLYGVSVDTVLCGVIMLRDNNDDSHEVSYWIAHSARNRGVMQRALTLCLDMLPASTFPTLVAKVMHGNVASATILNRCKFHLTHCDQMWMHFKLQR